jgi:hypothetical protein
MTAQDIGAILFIVLAGTLGTDLWRWIGVYGGKRLSEESEALVWVRSVATALVAGVIASQVLYPGGILAGTPVALRLGAAFAGFSVFLVLKKNMLVGLAVSLAVLATGLYVLGI